MVPMPARVLLPHFRSGGLQAISFALYTAALEVGACSAVTRARPFRDPSFAAGAVGYLLFVASDTLLMQGELQKAPYYTIQIEVMAMYVIAQVLILWSAAVDREAHAKAKGA
jgi:hypothetical protein